MIRFNLIGSWSRVRTLASCASFAGAANVGRVMGLVMKAHKGDVDPALVRRVVDEALKPAGCRPCTKTS